jgi:hypothetical protein
MTVDEMMKQSSRPTPAENIDLELIDLPTSETTSDSLFNLDDDLSHSGSSRKFFLLLSHFSPNRDISD